MNNDAKSNADSNFESKLKQLKPSECGPSHEMFYRAGWQAALQQHEQDRASTQSSRSIRFSSGLIVGIAAGILVALTINPMRDENNGSSTKLTEAPLATPSIIEPNIASSEIPKQSTRDASIETAVQPYVPSWRAYSFAINDRQRKGRLIGSQTKGLEAPLDSERQSILNAARNRTQPTSDASEDAETSSPPVLRNEPFNMDRYRDLY